MVPRSASRKKYTRWFWSFESGNSRANTRSVAPQVAASAAVSPEMVKGYADAFASAGCDELIFIPTTAAPDQVGLLASAVL